MTIAALIVGHDDLGEFGRQIGGLGDHPDAGFGPVRAGDDAAQIAGAIWLAGLAVCCATSRAGTAARRMALPIAAILRKIEKASA